MADRYQVAQLNIARARAPWDDPVMADFMARLAEVNALAERSPGFVWRLKGDSGNSTDLCIGDDPRIIVNLTVWETIDDMFAYTYRSDHKTVFARRFDWFERWEGPSVVMWWQPAGTIPDVGDALRRLRLLGDRGRPRGRSRSSSGARRLPDHRRLRGARAASVDGPWASGILRATPVRRTGGGCGHRA